MLHRMRHPTLEIIRDEHRALAAMLRSLLMLLAQARREHRRPDFEVLRAMVFYIDEFPERLHHPKESGLLFPRVAARCPELEPLIARLERQHADGEHAVRELQHELLAFEVMGDPRRAAFERTAERYVHAYLEHMALEEQEILPAAQRVFGAEDWAPLDEAFGSNADPLTGRYPAPPDYRPLFQRILMTAPAPIGLGPS